MDNKSVAKKIVIDLDATLTRPGSSGNYIDHPPYTEVVDRIKEYKENGFEIVIYTSRNMRTHRNSVGKIIAKTVPTIIDWLEMHDVPFDEIHVGKPWCGHLGFYVDDKSIRPDEFVSLSNEEILALIGTESPE